MRSIGLSIRPHDTSIGPTFRLVGHVTTSCSEQVARNQSREVTALKDRLRNHDRQQGADQVDVLEDRERHRDQQKQHEKEEQGVESKPQASHHSQHK